MRDIELWNEWLALALSEQPRRNPQGLKARSRARDDKSRCVRTPQYQANYPLESK